VVALLLTLGVASTGYAQTPGGSGEMMMGKKGKMMERKDGKK
jgi:hypothetical protein